MILAICTHPERCGAMEQAHSDMAAQLAAATATVQLLRAQLVAADETNAAIMADNDRLRGDVQMYMQMFEQECRKAVRA